MPAVEIVTFFLQTGWVAKVVLVTLIIFSLASWSVILGKWRELAAARRASDRFLKVFREVSRLNEAAATASKYRASPLAAMFQIAGGLAIAVGLLVRPLALAFVGYSLLTALIFHTDFGDAAQIVHMGKNTAIAGGFLFLFVAGPGAVSLDAWRARTGRA